MYYLLLIGVCNLFLTASFGFDLKPEVCIKDKPCLTNDDCCLGTCCFDNVCKESWNCSPCKNVKCMVGESCYLSEDPLRPYQKPQAVCALDYPCLVKDCGIENNCQQEQIGNQPPKAICLPKQDLCIGYNCPYNMQCYIEEDECTEYPTLPQPRCAYSSPCAFNKCKPGFECSVCKEVGRAPRGSCLPVVRSCTDIKCAAGEKCYTTDVFCTKQPCVPVAVCASRDPCATVSCGEGFSCINQQNGNKPPDYKCVVNINPCTNKRCPIGQKCYIERMMCIRSPCPPASGYCSESNPCVRHNCGDGYDCVVDASGYDGGFGAPKPVCVNRANPCYGYSCPSYATCAYNATQCPPGQTCPTQLPFCVPNYPCKATNICPPDQMCIPQYNSGGEPSHECVPKIDACKNIGCPLGTQCTVFGRYPTQPICARSSNGIGS